MTDRGYIPQILDVVHTDDLPVEVEAEYELRVWHDEAGEWCRLVPGDWYEVEPPGARPRVRHYGTIIERCTDDGTLRICELVPVSEYERKDGE